MKTLETIATVVICTLWIMLNILVVYGLAVGCYFISVYFDTDWISAVCCLTVCGMVILQAITLHDDFYWIAKRNLRGIK